MAQKFICSLLFLLPLCATTSAQEPARPYKHDGILFPNGVASFADYVISPHETDIYDSSQSTHNALGKPDGKLLTLGCQGELIVKFTDNALVNIDGDDLHIFEKGQNIESTILAISENGDDWIDLGAIPGAEASIDIGNHVSRGQVFTYVRLLDRGIACGRNAGADIDAIGAIGSVKPVKFENDILFDLGSGLID